MVRCSPGVCSPFYRGRVAATGSKGQSSCDTPSVTVAAIVFYNTSTV
jgi:hypothetical protein